MTIGDVSPTQSTPPTGLRRMAAALAYRDFRVLWIGAFVSTIGTWMQKVAQKLAGADPDRLRVSLLSSDSIRFWASCRSCSSRSSAGSSQTGATGVSCCSRRNTSRWRRRSRLAAARVFRHRPHRHILALSVVTGLAQAFGGPAHQSLMPSLVDKKDLPNAIAFNSIQFNLARVIGPLLAGAALTAFGMVACFALNGSLVSRRDRGDPLAPHPAHTDHGHDADA